MNCRNKKTSQRRARQPALGFTLTELMMAMAVFSLMVAGILATNLYGLRMSQVVGAKLNVSSWSRLTMEKLQDEIHSCKNLQLGTVTNGFFTGLLDGETQQCSGLLIYPSSTNSYILYYVNDADQTLRRMTEQANSAVIMASSVISPQPFSAQDMTGNILTNNLKNSVIHLALEFNQPAYFMVQSDYYKFETAVKQRIVP